MNIIKINRKAVTKKQISLIVKCLKQGQVIAYPADTVYGLGCLANNEKAVAKVRRIKKQPKTKPLLVLVSGLTMLKKYCRLKKAQEPYLKKIWPGPVTVILDRKDNLPKELTGKSSGLAVRLPKNDFLIKIIKSAGAPLVSTSLNVAGQPVLTSVINLDKYFKKDKPDLAADAGEIKGKHSRLIDLREIDNVKVIRE